MSPTLYRISFGLCGGDCTRRRGSKRSAALLAARLLSLLLELREIKVELYCVELSKSKQVFCYRITWHASPCCTSSQVDFASELNKVTAPPLSGNTRASFQAVDSCLSSICSMSPLLLCAIVAVMIDGGRFLLVPRELSGSCLRNRTHL